MLLFFLICTEKYLDSYLRLFRFVNKLSVIYLFTEKYRIVFQIP